MRNALTKIVWVVGGVFLYLALLRSAIALMTATLWVVSTLILLVTGDPAAGVHCQEPDSPSVSNPDSTPMATPAAPREPRRDPRSSWPCQYDWYMDSANAFSNVPCWRYCTCLAPTPLPTWDP